MKVDIQDVGSGKNIIKIEIPVEEVNAEFEKAYEEVRKNIEVPGFRKGRAPRNILRLRFHEYVKNEVIEALVPPAYKKALEDSKLDVVGSPDIYPPIEQSIFGIDAELQDNLDKEEIPEILKQEFQNKDIIISEKAVISVEEAGNKWMLTDGRKRYIISKNSGTTYVQLDELSAKEDEPLIFEIGIATKPNIDIPDLSLLEIDESDVDVTEEDVNKYIELLRKESAVYDPIEDRSAQDGDSVFINYRITYEDKLVDSGQNSLINMGEKEGLLELDQALIDMKPGDEKDIPVTMPENFRNPEYAGKEVNIHITLNRLCKRQLPELNDEFAKEKGSDDFEQFKAKTWNDLVEMQRRDKRESQEIGLMTQLIDKTNVDIPEILIKSRAEILMKNSEDREFTEEETNNFREFSARMIKREWIINEIVKRENITLVDAEVDMEIERIANALNKDPQKYKIQLEGANRLDALKDNLLTMKVYNLLVERASVKKGLIV
ncbi:MAG: trigger factor [Candidatus Poribacteria bacterium]